MEPEPMSSLINYPAYSNVSIFQDFTMDRKNKVAIYYNLFLVTLSTIVQWRTLCKGGIYHKSKDFQEIICLKYLNRLPQRHLAVRVYVSQEKKEQENVVLVKTSCKCVVSKVHIFCEGHKILQNLRIYEL